MSVRPFFYRATFLALALAGCELFRDDGDSAPAIVHDYSLDTLGGAITVGSYTHFPPGTKWTYSVEYVSYPTGDTTLGSYSISILEPSPSGLPIRCQAVMQYDTGPRTLDTLVHCPPETGTLGCIATLPEGFQLPFYASDRIDAGRAREVLKEDTVRFEFEDAKMTSSNVYVTHIYQSNLGLVQYRLQVLSGMGGHTSIRLIRFERGKERG